MASVSTHAGPALATVSYARTSVDLPTLSNSTLILLGVLMAVIAVRVIRSGKGTMNRMAGILLVTGGLLSSGHGIESTLAGAANVTISGANCSTGGTSQFPPFSIFTFNNQCLTALLITDISLDCTVIIPGTCTVGEVVEPGQECQLPSCGPP